MKRAHKKSRALAISEKIYSFLLMAYPGEHRQEYGPSMVQLFRDQCLDASRESGVRGLVMLWCRTLLDLVKTATLERLATIKGKEFMFKKSFMEMRSRSATALAISASIFFLVVIVSILIIFMLPKMYASTARLTLSSSKNSYDPYLVQTEFETIESDVILDKVIEKLELNETYGKKFNAGSKLKTAESRGILKSQLELRPVRNTSLIDIRVYSDDKNEAAKIANETATVYQDYRSKEDNKLSGDTSKRTELAKIQPVQIVDRAEPGIRRIRPDAYLNIFYGLIIGIVAGGGAGFLFLLVAALRKPKAMA